MEREELAKRLSEEKRPHKARRELEEARLMAVLIEGTEAEQAFDLQPSWVAQQPGGAQ